MEEKVKSANGLTMKTRQRKVEAGISGRVGEGDKEEARGDYES